MRLKGRKGRGWEENESSDLVSLFTPSLASAMLHNDSDEDETDKMQR